MCANLQNSGEHEVIAFDVDREKLENLRAVGVSIAPGVGEAVAGIDLVMTSLPGPKQVADVAFSPNGIFHNIDIGGSYRC